MFQDQLDAATYQHFKQNLFYSQKIAGRRLRVIALNTQADDGINMMLMQNPTDPKNMVPSVAHFQLAWLVNELLSAEKAGDDVFIIGHFPGQQLFGSLSPYF